MIFATHLTTATVLFEIFGLKILTDPVFDPAGGIDDIYGIPGTRYQSDTTSALPLSSVLPVDYVLLSHDQHLDNLDHSGRAMLPLAKKVYTTSAGAKRLGGNSVGLKPFEKVLIHSKDGIPVTITATPCRHGPLGCGLIVGDVIGFMIEWPGQAGGALYLSGDTVFYSGLLEISRRFQIGTAFLNMGSAQMKCTGPVRYTLNSKDAALTAKALKIKNVIPLHYEGWSHFSEKKSQIEPHFRSENSQCKIQWLTPGIRTQILIQE